MLPPAATADLARFRLQFARDMKVRIIVDHESMVDLATFHWTDLRFRQILLEIDHLFGGLNILICGDFFQFPLVRSEAVRPSYIERFREKGNRGNVGAGGGASQRSPRCSVAHALKKGRGKRYVVHTR